MRAGGAVVAEVDRRHGPECACARCRGFEPGNEHGVETRATPGNDLAVRHGAYATLRLGPRAAEIADELRADVPLYRPADEVALLLLATTLARIEAAEKVLLAIDERLGGTAGGSYVGMSEAAELLAQVQRLRQDQRGWLNSALRILNDLGLTPTARARLGLDVAQTRRTVTLTELAAEAEEERRRDGGG